VRRRHLLAAASLLIAVAGAPLAHAAPGNAGPPDHAPAHGFRQNLAAQPVAEDPPFSIDAERARTESVDCTEVPEAAPDVDAVVLVHGTGTQGHQQYDWNYALRLAEEGIPFCIVTYPERGFGDMQVSAEYVVVAVHEAAAISPSGRVDLVGHSQGATMPRWAVKYWPSVQSLVDDFVLHAGPNHGTWAADEPVAPALVGTPLQPFGARPPVLWQFRTDSDFNRYLNHGDETPGDIDYTSIYAHTDELVQPSGSNGPATAALHVDDPAKVVNINVQDVCPGRLVEHLSIGTTDRFVMELTIATLRAPGPADLSLVDTTLCSLPDQYVTPATVPALLGGAFADPDPSSGSAWLDPSRYVTEEPPIRDYAVARDGSAH
jgi:triacylglycerol lipase